MSPPDHEIAIVGAGFAGLGMAAALRRAGREDFVLYESADSVGGTWRDNHYPGCACDVPTPLYSFSFAPNPEWSHLYARHGEIRDYLEDVTDRFDIRPHVRLGCGVLAAAWDEAEQLWRLELADGSSSTARFVVAGIGGLNRPAYPEIEGLEGFAGELMHSAAWDHGVELEGRRVAVIGTGASAIQIVPKIAATTGQLDVFQRTPPWVMPQIDIEMKPWMRWLFRRLPITQRLLRATIWAIQESVAFPLTKAPWLTRLLELGARRNIRRAVSDPELRRALTPDYRMGCKRMLLSNAYYPAIDRDDVDVVTAPIERVVPEGIVTADGELHEADVIVCATGFDIREALGQADLRGRGGISLPEAWSRRIEAYRGTLIHGFPNLAMLSGPNTGTGNMSQVFMIESQVRFVMALLGRMAERDEIEFEPTAEAQAAFNRELEQRMQGTVWLTGGCSSWYLTDEGHTGVLYPGFSTSFRRSLARVNEAELAFSKPREAEPTAPEVEVLL